MVDGSHFARERLMAFTLWHPDAVSGSHPPHLSWVKRRNTRCEHIESALPPIADSSRTLLEVRFVPCVDGSELARAFFTFCSIGRCSHVFGLLMRFHMTAGHN